MIHIYLQLPEKKPIKHHSETKIEEAISLYHKQLPQGTFNPRDTSEASMLAYSHISHSTTSCKVWIGILSHYL